MDISFIIVNYKSAQCLKECVLSLKENLKDFLYEVIVVNNDEHALDNIEPSENIFIINNEANKGFSQACNLGASSAKGEIIFFLNPDTLIKSGPWMSIIKAFENPLVGIAAPRLTIPDGKPQPWSMGYEVTPWSILSGNLWAHKYTKLRESAQPKNIGWVSGAALAIRRQLFEDLHGFDEKFFMYFEDVDLCKRALENGKEIRLLPDVQVLHLGGQSFSDPKRQKKYYYSSQDYYLKKHFGRLPTLFVGLLRNLVLLFK